MDLPLGTAVRKGAGAASAWRPEHNIPCPLLTAALAIWLVLLAGLLSCSGGGGRHTPPGAQGNFAKARQAYESGHHLRAIELLEAFEHNHPGSQYIDDAFYYLGKAHQASGEQLLARQAFNRLLNGFPRSEYAEASYFALAHSWFLSMRGPALDPEPAEEALVAFRGYLRRYPEGAHREEAELAILEVRGNLAKKDYLNGRTYMRLGRPAAARRYFRKSLEHWGESSVSAKAWDGIAHSYEAQDMWAEAREAYAALIGHLGDDPDRYEDGKKIAKSARRKMDTLPQ